MEPQRPQSLQSAGASAVAELTPSRRERAASLWAATELATDLDLDRLAQRVVEGVAEVTDFAVATLTVREHDTCRRIAAAGTDDPRIGLRTPYAKWDRLLDDAHRRLAACFLIPPQASDTDWMQTVPLASPPRADGEGPVWTAEHGLVVELLDTAGERIGFLSVDAPRSGLLPDDTELEQLELFARQVQNALRNARLLDEVRRQRDAAEALNKVGRAVSASLDLREVLRLCCDAVVEHSVAERASIYLFDPESSRFRTVMSRGGASDPDLWQAFQQLPPVTLDEVPVFAEVLLTGQPVRVGAVTTEHVRHHELQLFSLKSLAAYPLRWSDRTEGILVTDTSSQHLTFPDYEVELVSQIAGQAAVAINQAQLHEAVRAHAARADELYELTKQMTRTFDFDAIFAGIVEAVEARTGAYAIGLMAVEGDELALLRTNVDTGPGAALPYERVRVADLPDGMWDRLSADGTVVIEDLDGSGLRQHARSEARSLLIAAHRDEDRISLVLHVSSHRVAGFTSDDEAFVQGLVEVAALALRNARLYEEARHYADRDGLTGLKNRRVYRREVGALVEAAAVDVPVALAVIDVDDFKAVNDRYGHDAGDRALVHVADRIARSVREDDHTYRLGGEEFAVVMPDTTADGAARVIDRLRRAVAVRRDETVSITVSAGIAVAPGDGWDLDTLFRAADAALYAAKAAGKDTIRVADGRAPAPSA